jgi:hypothetical protein
MSKDLTADTLAVATATNLLTKIEEAAKVPAELAAELCQYRDASFDDPLKMHAWVQRFAEWAASLAASQAVATAHMVAFLHAVSSTVSDDTLAKIVVPEDKNDRRRARAAHTWLLLILVEVRLCPSYDWISLPVPARPLAQWWAENRAVIGVLRAFTASNAGNSDNIQTVVRSVDRTIMHILYRALKRDGPRVHDMDMARSTFPSVRLMLQDAKWSHFVWPADSRKDTSKASGVSKKYIEAAAMTLRDCAGYDACRRAR